MTRYALLDRHNSILQWTGEAETARAALAALDDEVGIDPLGLGLDVVAGGFWAILLTPALEAALDVWHEAGSPAAESPLTDRDLMTV